MTACEMPISDWSSDVCSSDLGFGIFCCSHPAPAVRRSGGAGLCAIAFQTRAFRPPACCARAQYWGDHNHQQRNRFYRRSGAFGRKLDHFVNHSALSTKLKENWFWPLALLLLGFVAWISWSMPVRIPREWEYAVVFDALEIG